MNMKLFKNFITSLIAAAFVAGIAACSNDSGTAGVLTETESGKTANADTSDIAEYTAMDFSDYVTTDPEKLVYVGGTVKDTKGVPLALARVFLTAQDSSHHTVVRDSTETDDDGRFTFGKIDDCPSYNKTDNCQHVNLLVRARSGSEITLQGVGQVYNGYNRKDSLDIEIEAGEPAKVVIYLNYLDYGNTKADSICLAGTFNCIRISENDREKGFITLENLPIGKIENMYVWEENGVSKQSFIGETKAGTTFYMNYKAGGYPLDSLQFALPAKTVKLMDSLKLDEPLGSLPVPITVQDTHAYYKLVDEYGNFIPYVAADNETEESRFWALHQEVREDSTKARWLANGWVSSDHMNHWTFPYHLYATAEAGLAFDDSLFETRHYTSVNCINITYSPDSPYPNTYECDTTGTYTESDSTIGISFWIEADGSVVDDSGSGTTLISAGSEEAGFKIAQCEADPQFICSQIFSGDETKDATLYGKAKAMDGKRHHVSFVIYGKHLAIAVDGETVHSTDLKLASKFYEGFAGITVGEFTLSDLFIYEPKNLVTKPKENGWNRLKAWLNAFYEMQK